MPGLSLEVLEFADRLLLTNHTGKTVTIYGYQGEPYARVLANGTAEQNTRSPATYLNTSFYGNVTVPASASPSAPPHWVVVDRTGQFEWHDHRIHWMSPLTPPQVKDKSKRTLIFDWQVPIRVGDADGRGERAAVLDARELARLDAVIVLGVVIALLGLAVRAVRAPASRACRRGSGRRPRRSSATGHEPPRPPTAVPRRRRRKRGEGVIAFVAMAALACLMHWYISMLYVVPVLVVGRLVLVELQAHVPPLGPAEHHARGVTTGRARSTGRGSIAVARARSHRRSDRRDRAGSAAGFAISSRALSCA